MTSTGIAYMEYLETERSNKVREAETHRNNVQVELETRRANIARENENFRSHVAAEELQRFSNWTERGHLERMDLETQRHNIAGELENYRTHVENEKIGNLNALANLSNAANGAIANLVNLQSVKVDMYNADTRRQEYRANNWYRAIDASINAQNANTNARQADIAEGRLNLDAWRYHDESSRAWSILPYTQRELDTRASEHISQAGLNVARKWNTYVHNFTDVADSGANLLNAVGNVVGKTLPLIGGN